MSSFHVSKLSPELVGPSEPTPSIKLALSSLDPKILAHIEVMQVFRHGRGPASAAKEALSKALVPYYPVAGRIVTAENHVHCTGEGVWFVEASADCSLQDVEFLQNLPITAIPKEDLLPSPPPQVDEALVIFMIQVTEFKCGGFVVGVKFNHMFFDGIGSAQFTRTVGEIAAGGGGSGTYTTFKPIWCRDAIPTPPKRFPTTNYEPRPPAVEYVIDFSHDQVRRTQDRFFNETGKKCSVFEVVSAKLWQSRTRAIGRDPDVIATLVSPVDVRRLLIEEVLKLEGDYYGNCVYHLVANARSDRIAGASLVEVVSLVREAKGSLPDRLSTWLKGGPRENPWINVDSITYSFIHLVDWRWIGFGEVDFGWGRPVSVGPLSANQGCNVLLKSPLPDVEGVRLVTCSVAREHMEAFQNEMKKEEL